ncbi:MAG: DUF362 domain-containing protein [Candidatus Riflebacteria bacterium]|nr:DUF362 domain-containing protein [Candidatus Riflebacteria bacterium]
MNRRTFLQWLMASIGGLCIGHGLGQTRLPLSRVTLLEASSYDVDLVSGLMAAMGEDGLALSGKRVLLKPNFVEVHPGRPINTHPSLIRQVAEACLRLGAREVLVGEAAGHRRDPWFSVMNPDFIKSLPAGVRCVDLNYSRVVRVRNTSAYGALAEFLLPLPLLSSDVVIGLPKMKTHHWMGVTLAMKNLFGVMPGVIYGWPKNTLHVSGLGQTIVDLARCVPTHYHIVDGITGMEGDGPILGTPLQVGVVVAGRDILAVDTTAARIMGFDPMQVPYMRVAAWHLPGFGEHRKTYAGKPMTAFARDFQCLEKYQEWKLNRLKK